MSKARQLADNAAAEPNKNMVINGAMQVSQRGDVTGKTSATYGGPDRFALGITSHGTYSISQSTTVPTGYGFPNSYKLDCTTADTSIAANAEVTIQYKMEGQDLQRLKKGTSSAEAVTISFWCKSNLTGTYTLEIYDSDNTRHFPQNYTISSADTWEHKVLTFAGDTTGAFTNDNNHSAVLVWWLAAGSNYTGGTQSTEWGTASSADKRVSSSIVNMSSSTSNEFLLTGVQMEIGSYVTPFQFESYATTLEKCQRYFSIEKAGSGGQYKRYAHGGAVSTTQGSCSVALSTPLRTTPTLVLSGAVSTFLAHSAGGTDALTSLIIANDDDGGTHNRLIEVTPVVSSGLVAGDIVSIISNNSTSTSIAFDAEL